MRHYLLIIGILSSTITTHAQWVTGGMFSTVVHFQACAFHSTNAGLFVYGANNPGPSPSATEGGVIRTDDGAAGGGFYIWYEPSMNLEDIDVKLVNGQPLYLAVGHELYNRSVVVRPYDFPANPLALDSIRTGTSRYYRAVRMRNDLVAFAAGGNSLGDGIIDMSVDSGQTWANIAVLPGQVVSRLHFVNDELAFAATGGYRRLNNNGIMLPDSGAIYRSSDGGSNWQQVHASNVSGFSDVEFLNADIGVATRNDGMILRTVDGGGTWLPATVAISGNFVLTGVEFRSDGVGFATGYRPDGSEGLILSSSDSGASWGFNFSTAAINSARRLYDVYFHDVAHGYASGHMRPMRTNGIVTNVPEEEEHAMALYPNPTTDSFTLNTLSAGPVQVEIHDGAGRMVRALRVQGPSAVIDVSDLMPGSYVVRVTDGSEVRSVKLLRL